MLDTYQTLIQSPFTWIAAAFALVMLVLTQVRSAETARPGKLATLLEKLGLADIPYAVAFIGLTLWLLIFASFTLGLLYVMGRAVFTIATDTDTATDLRWSLITMAGLTATIGAIIALPFTIARVRFTARQTETAEQGHITDRINKAVEGLGAEKTVTFQRKNQEGNLTYERKEDGSNYYSNPVIVTETQPNLEVRIGAIYALERIAQDSLRDHVQIMEILCAYIRQNAPVANALTLPENLDSRTKIKDWAETLPSARMDIQTAVDVIGRREAASIETERHGDSFAKTAGFRIDLRATNLQKVSFSTLNFANAQLAQSRLDGAVFWRADLRGSILSNCQAHGATFREVNLEEANLREACMQGVDLRNSNMRNSEMSWLQLDFANMRKADLSGAKINSAHLGGANLYKANLSGAILRRTVFSTPAVMEKVILKGAALRNVQLGEYLALSNIIPQAFGDRTVGLPQCLSCGQAPIAHWPTGDLNLSEFYEEWRAWQQSMTEDTQSPPR